MKFIKQLATVAAASSFIAIASVPAQAATFNNSGISFDTDTTVKFDFLQSNGYYTSDLSIVDSAKNKVFTLFSEGANSLGYDSPKVGDFLGTCGKADSTVLAPCTKNFTFAAGKMYSLLLDSGKDGKVYSTDALNTPAIMQAVFSGDVFASIGSTIKFDDKGNKNDKDFNDFQVRATAVPVPEPATLGGLGLVTGALFVSRRRKSIKLSTEA